MEKSGMRGNGLDSTAGFVYILSDPKNLIAERRAQFEPAFLACIAVWMKKKMTQTTLETNESHSSGLGSGGDATPEARLTSFLEDRLHSLGYELVAIDLLNHREKKTLYLH